MKIAACDFDGTLFRDGVVSEADLEAIADWRRSGNAFGIVTGRGRNTLLRDVKRFSIPYDFLICNNGAMICDEQAQDVYCAVLPEPVRAEIMDHPGMRASSQCAFFAGTAIFTHAGKTDYWILKEHVLPRLSPVEALHMPGLHQISLAYAEPGESAAWSEAFTEGCGENAGVHVLVHLPRGLSEAEAVQRAKEDGVRVYGLERYCIGAAADPAQGGTVLLGYAGLSEEEIAEAAAILKKCWNA